MILTLDIISTWENICDVSVPLFFKLIVYSRLDCEVLSRLSMVFLLFGNGTLLIFFKPQQSRMIFFLIRGRHLSGRVQCSHGPRPWCAQRWVQATPSIMRDICRAVSNIVTGPLPTISVMILGNPIYELLYEFKLLCHLLGNLSIRSSPFDNSGFGSRESVNIKYCINNSGIWGPTRHLSLKITNSLAILRLRKPLKPQPGWPATGFEPGTSRMQVSCVTMEPPRSVLLYCNTRQLDINISANSFLLIQIQPPIFWDHCP